MQDPFRDGGPLDRGMPVLTLLSSLGFVVNEIKLDHGFTVYGAALGTVLAVLNIHQLVRWAKQRRRKQQPRT